MQNVSYPRLFSSVGLTYVIVQLKKALIDFGTLSDSVDDFSAWLARMVQLQLTTEKIASSLQTAKGQKLKVKGLKKSWDAIKDDYMKYNVQVRIHVIIITNIMNDKFEPLLRSNSCRTCIRRGTPHKNGQRM